MQVIYRSLSLCMAFALALPQPLLAENNAKTEQPEVQILLEDFLLSAYRDRKYSAWIERNVKPQERGAWRQAFGRLLKDEWPRILVNRNSLLIFSEKARTSPEVITLAKDAEGRFRLVHNARDITRHENETFSAWLTRAFPQAAANHKPGKKRSVQALLDLLIPEAEAGFFAPLLAGLIGGGVGSYVGSRSGTRAGIVSSARDGYLTGGGSGADYYSTIINQAGFSSGEIEALRAELGESLGRLQRSSEAIAQEVRSLRQYLETDFQAFLKEAIRMMPGYEAEVRRKILEALRRKVAREVYEGFGLTCPLTEKGGTAAFRIEIQGQLVDVSSRVDDAGRLEMDFRDPANTERTGSYLYSFDSNAMRARSRTGTGTNSSTTDSDVALAPFLKPDSRTYVDTMRDEAYSNADPKTKALVDDALIAAAFCENYDGSKLVTYLLDKDPKLSPEELAEFNNSAPLAYLRSCLDQSANTSRGQSLGRALRKFAGSPPNPNCLAPSTSLPCTNFLQAAESCIGSVVSANMRTTEASLLPRQREAARAAVAGWGPGKRAEVLRRLYSVPFSEVILC